jgi:hypothetical protein
MNVAKHPTLFQVKRRAPRLEARQMSWVFKPQKPIQTRAEASRRMPGK